MKLTFVGSGGTSISPKRACPSLLVNDSLIFDLGPGSVTNIRKTDIKLDQLSKVFISHCHADHISDLMPFLWATQIDGRTTPLEIYGPVGFKDIFQKLRECTNTSEKFFTFSLCVKELDFGERLDNVSTCRTDHAIPTLAFRVDEDGKSLCYSADTTYCPRVVELANQTDLLVHEATFLEEQESIAELTRHSTGRMAGRCGRESRARRLVLFHIPPPNEHREDEIRQAAEQEYGSEVQVASDLVSIAM
ncbi:MAG TPA: MBL fold metallo-hydrolase [Terriglobales bacterium]|nr:MBL fold metallo-hydrolase [Terriglobales bacterium]